MIGTTISHYRILEKLGEGGMGVVYKTQDVRLDRVVALKFLPRHISANDAEKTRFLQEAKAAAALNHPNICTIHGIEEDGTEHFIVMEFVDGVTLRDKLEKGPIQTKDAVAYAIQIGDALQEAHCKGIVHRDIKADNVMVNTKNQIKVMDFGLAKLKGSLKLTKTSSTVGTLAYMAPEQIQAGEVDARSDIFSFGIVLFEMLTGHLPFRGEHEAALVYSIVNEEPEPIQKHLPDISSELVHVLNTALEKQREDRYQSVTEMVRDLRRVQKQTSRVSRVVDATMTTSQYEAHILDKKSTSKMIYMAGAAVVILVVALLLMLVFNSSVELNPNMTFRALQIPFRQLSPCALSLDGNWVAFAAFDISGKRNLYFMNTSGGEPRQVTLDQTFPPLLGTPRAHLEQPDISPDGSQIVFLSYRQSRADICIVSSLGGNIKKIADRGVLPSWKPDGSRISFISSSNRDLFASGTIGNLEFWTMNPEGGDKHLEFVDTSESSENYGYSWSPDGKSVVWIRALGQSHEELFVHELETGKETQISFEKKRIRAVYWARNGQIFFSSNKTGNENIWMISASDGLPAQITRGPGPDVGAKGSADGKRLTYLQSQPLGTIWIANSDGSNARQITTDERSVWVPSLSPNRKHIAVEIGETDQLPYTSYIYLLDRDGNNPHAVKSGPEVATNAVWSPNGKWIAYSSRPNTQPRDSANVHIIDPSNPASPLLLGKGVPHRWLNDTSLIAVTLTASWVLSTKGHDPKQFYLDSTWAYPILNGKYVLYYDLRPDREGTWITEASSSSAKPRKLLEAPTIRTIFSYPFSLAADGKSLLHVNRIGEVWKMRLPEGTQQRLPGSYPSVGRASFINLSYDNKEIVYLERHFSAKIVMIENPFR